MRSLYLVRHGKPQYPDEHSYCVGQTDFSLSMLGHLQAVLLNEELSDKISSPEQATQDNTIKVINIAANNFLILIESIIPFLLNKSDKQGKDNNTSHEQHPKTTNGCRNNIYYISAITIFDTNNRNYQSYKNTKDIDPRPCRTYTICQCNME